jgi:nitrogen fixation NifU-like protein
MTALPPEVAALYQRVILDHNARPRNAGPLASPTHEARAHNPLCGDTVTLRLRVDGGRIAEARFEAEGCALCRASASLLTLAVAGRTPEEAAAVAADLDRFLARGPDRDEAAASRLGDLTALAGVRDVPARRRCATLPWEALRAALGPV